MWGWLHLYSAHFQVLCYAVLAPVLRWYLEDVTERGLASSAQAAGIPRNWRSIRLDKSTPLGLVGSDTECFWSGPVRCAAVILLLLDLLLLSQSSCDWSCIPYLTVFHYKWFVNWNAVLPINTWTLSYARLFCFCVISFNYTVANIMQSSSLKQENVTSWRKILDCLTGLAARQ